MSRFRIFFMLAFPFVLAAGAAVFVFQQLGDNYRQQVLGPLMQKEMASAKASQELFAFGKTQIAAKFARRANLVAAFQEASEKSRKGKVYVELSALQAEKELKTSAVLIATDDKGFAFARSGEAPSWKGEDWKKKTLVGQALNGLPSHGLISYEGKLHVFVAAPVVARSVAASDMSKDDAQDGTKPTKAGKAVKRAAPPVKKTCPAGRKYLCYNRCLKREPKTRKCLKRETKKTCGCFRVRSRKPKKRASLSAHQLLALAQTAPDARATANTGDAAPKKAATGQDEKLLGVLLFGFAVDGRLAQHIKSAINTDVAFFSKKGEFYSSSLSGRARTKVSDFIIKNSANFDDKAKNIVDIDLNGTPHLAMSSISKGSDIGLLVLHSLKPHRELYRNQVMWLAVIGLSGLLLAIILLFIGVTRFQNHLEKIEEKVLETYNTGNLQFTFSETAPWMAGSLGAALNRLYRQLRGEPDPEDAYTEGQGWGGLAGVAGAETIAAVEGAREVPGHVVGEARPSDDEIMREMLAAQDAPPSSSEITGLVAAVSLEQIAEQQGLDPEAVLAARIESVMHDPEPHYEEIYEKYRDAKAAVGSDLSRLKKDRFIRKLRQNAQRCREQYNCRGVLFDVTVKDSKVILKPQLIPYE